MVLRSLSKGCAACHERESCPRKHMEEHGYLVQNGMNRANRDAGCKASHETIEVHLASDLVVNIDKDTLMRQLEERFDPMHQFLDFGC